jgi:hypothetical protein
MGEIHRLLTEHGKQKVLQLDFDRGIIDAAANYLGSEGDVGFLYSGWAQSALPHRRLADDEAWRVATDYLTLIVQPGMRSDANGKLRAVGVPYGSRARLILIYLQSQALRNNSREVELGRSLHAWMSRLGIPIGGKSLAAVRDQAERISMCHLSFEIKQGEKVGMMKQSVVDTALFAPDPTSPTRAQFTERAMLSERFFEALKRHPVPIEEAAISSIANNSQAIDIYCWLAYRLHSLSKPTVVTWKALYPQLGAGTSSVRNFRDNFKKPLALALSVYPDAKVESDRRGMTLHPSRPPVAPKIVALMRRS